jgi:hypothetical protein
LSIPPSFSLKTGYSSTTKLIIEQLGAIVAQDILTETIGGYALLKARDEKLLKRHDLATEMVTAEGVSNL